MDRGRGHRRRAAGHPSPGGFAAWRAPISATSRAPSRPRGAEPGQVNDDGDKPKDPSLLDKKPADAAVPEAAGPASGPPFYEKWQFWVHRGRRRGRGRRLVWAGRQLSHTSSAAATCGRATCSSSVASGRGTDARLLPALVLGGGRAAGAAGCSEYHYYDIRSRLRRRAVQSAPAISQVQTCHVFVTRRRHRRLHLEGTLPDTAAAVDEHRDLRVLDLRRFRHAHLHDPDLRRRRVRQLPGRQPGRRRSRPPPRSTTTDDLTSMADDLIVDMPAHADELPVSSARPCGSRTLAPLGRRSSRRSGRRRRARPPGTGAGAASGAPRSGGRARA